MHVLTRRPQCCQGKNQEGQTEEEVTDIAVLLLIDKDNTYEKGRIGQVANVKRHTRRHNPCCQGCTNVSTHNDRNSLCQRQQSCIDERHCHYGSCGRRLYTGRNKHTRQHTSKTIGSHGAKDVSQLRTRHLLKGFTHRLHTIHQECQRAQKRENYPDRHNIFIKLFYFSTIFRTFVAPKTLCLWNNKSKSVAKIIKNL